MSNSEDERIHLLYDDGTEQWVESNVGGAFGLLWRNHVNGGESPSIILDVLFHIEDVGNDK
jgi:hypothetical protein